MTGNDSLFTRAKSAIPGGVDSPVRAYGSVGGTPRFYSAAHGPYVHDVEGRRYTDLVCSWGPALLGHAHPEVVAAVQRAASQGLSFGAPTLGEVELAEAIAERVPACERMRLVSTGTEATMTAIRLARGVTGRDLLVKFAGCYHGHSDSLLAEAGSGIATAGLPGSAGVPEAIAAHTLVVPYNDEAAVRAVFAERGSQIAAVITEAAPANMGVVPPAPGFNAFLREITAEHGALFILDEVLTGFRVGPAGWWGLEQATTEGPGTRMAAEGPGTPMADEGPGAHATITGSGTRTASSTTTSTAAAGRPWAPDLFTFGKVVGGGMPLAALGGPAAIMDELAPLGPVYQAGTLSGNPLATAAGLATLRLADQGVYDYVDAAAARIRGALGEALADAGVPFAINHAGSLFSVFIGADPAESGVENYVDAKSQDAGAFGRFFHAMLDAGVALPPSCYEAWFLSAAHDEAALSHIEEAIRSSVAAI